MTVNCRTLATVLVLALCPVVFANGFSLVPSAHAVRLNNDANLALEPQGNLGEDWTYTWSTTAGSLSPDDGEAELTAPSQPGPVLVSVEVLDENQDLVGRYHAVLLAYRQFAIVKADDLVSYDSTLPASWQQYLAYMSETRRLKHSIGIITKSLENESLAEANVFTGNIRSQHASGLVEFWHHGFDHSGTPEGASPSLLNPLPERLSPLKMAAITEFSGQPYAFQKAHLEDGLKLSRDVLGITIHTFGAPFGASDSTTITVIDESADIEVWLDGLSGTTKRILPVDALLVENPTGYPLVEQFDQGYNPNANRVVLQVHPGFVDGGEDTFVERFDAWEEILDTIEDNNASFVTPYEYHRLLQDGLLPLHPDDDSDGDGISDWNEGYEDDDGDNIPDFMDPDAQGAAAPRVRNLSLTRTTPGTYEITFDLLSDNAQPLDLEVELLDANGTPSTLSSITGDVDDVVPGAASPITWDAAAELGTIEEQDVQIRITPRRDEPATLGMVNIDGGPFTQGCPDCASGGSFPSFPVMLDDYALGTREVSNAELADVLDYAFAQGYLLDSDGDPYAGGDVFHGGQMLVGLSSPECQITFAPNDFSPDTRDSLPMDDHPALFVTWYGAVAFCNWRSEMDGLTPAYTLGGTWRLRYPYTDGYRLPTEAEWERGATFAVPLDTALFGFGIGTIDTARANYQDDNPLSLTTEPYTSPGGYYDGNNSTTDSPSPAGAYDMSGNAAEWVHDQYAPYAEHEDPLVNPRGSDTRPRRVIKGGAWSDAATPLEWAEREDRFANHASNRVGFRIARSTATGAGDSAAFDIDTQAPMVTSIALVGTPDNDVFELTYEVEISEPVTGLDVSLFALDTTGTVERAPEITFLNGSGASYTLTVDTGIMQGDLVLTLDDSSGAVLDESDNPLTPATASSAPFSIDTLAPAVYGIALVGSPDLNAATVQFEVTFSKDVVLVEPGDFAVDTTGTVDVAPQVTLVEGSGSTRTVTVTINRIEGQLGLRIDDTDDSIQDSNNLPLGRLAESGLVHTADTIPPEVSLMALSEPVVPNAASFDVDVTFTETVTGLSVNDFSLLADGNVIDAPAITGLSGGGDAYVIAIDTGLLESGIELTFTASATVLDAAGNATEEDAASGVLANIDTIAPEALSITLINLPEPNAPSIIFEVQFSENMFSVSEDDFLAESSGSVDVEPSILEVLGSGSLYTVEVDTGAMEGGIGIGFVPQTATDFAGNPALDRLDPGFPHAADTRPPRLLSVTALTASPTAAGSVQFRLVFSEPVAGLNDEGDTNLVVTSTGPDYTLTTTQFDGNLFTLLVTLSGIGAGSGDITLLPRDALSSPPGAIKDANGNALADVSIPAASVTLDRTSPSPNCKAVTLLLDETGTATITELDEFDRGSTDDFPGEVTVIDVSETEFDCEDRGLNSVVVTIADALGNTATCNSFVVVFDPLLVCVPPVEGEGEGAEGEGEGIIEGEGEGMVEGEGEGIIEGEGEGEGEEPIRQHSGDWNGAPDGIFDLTELLRVIQLYNAGGLCCAPEGELEEDGYQLGVCEATTCERHAADYQDPPWVLNLSEILRVVQLFNLGGFDPCGEGESEDGFCPR